MGLMLAYTWRTLRDRAGGFIGAVLALFAAAAMVVACGALLETGLRGTVGTERYAASPVVVGGDQSVHEVSTFEKNGRTYEKHKAKPLTDRAWLPAETVTTLQDLPGVETAIGEVTFPTYAVEPGGHVADGVDGGASWGHSWDSAALTPFELTAGEPPQDSDDVVIDRELARRLGAEIGDEITVQTADAAPRPYRLAGVAAAREGDLAQQTSLFFAADEAERLSGRDGDVVAVGVLPADGVGTGTLAEQVEEALAGTGAQTYTGDDRGRVEFLGADTARIDLISVGAAMGGTALLVALLVVVGTFALSIQQRHRELALLRAVAATPRQTRRLIGREAMLVGLAAGGSGALAGAPLASWLHEQFVRLGTIPETLGLVVSPLPPVAAVGTTLLCGWAAARISARRVTRISPAAALTESAVDTRPLGLGRLLAGIVFTAGGAVLITVLSRLNTEPAATPVMFVSVIVLAVAVSLLGPLLARGAVAVLGVPLRAARLSGLLATENVRAGARRTAAAVTPLALLIAMACTVLFAQTTMGSVAKAQAEAGNMADWVLGSGGPGVPPEAAESVRELPGVTAVTEVIRTDVYIGLDSYPAQGATAAGLARTWDPDVVDGTLEDFDDGTVALSAVAANNQGVQPGDAVEVALADGTERKLTVSAVYARGLGFGDVTMPFALVSQHVDNPLASAVLVGTDGQTGRAAVVEAVDGYPEITVQAKDGVAGLQADVQQANTEVNYLAMGLVVAFTVIAVVNTLTMTISERVREFALLRLAGATRRQIRLMLRLEALLITLIATLLGSAVALAVLSAFSAGMTGDVSPSVPPSTYLLIVGSGALLALLASMVPGRFALATRPTEVVNMTR